MATLPQDLQRLSQPFAPADDGPPQKVPKQAPQSDQLTNEDLAALTETYRHLSDAGDPRAEKLRAFIGQQGNSILHPTPQADNRGLLERAWDWVNRGFISKDTVVKAMTGMSPEDLDRALAPRADDTPSQAYQAELWRGIMQSSAGVASSLTSPLSAATVGAGAAGRIPGTVGTIARAVGVPVSIALGAQGAAQATAPGLKNTPEAWEQRLQGLSQMAMGASGALEPEAVRTSAEAGKALVTRPAQAVKAGAEGIVKAAGTQLAPTPEEAMTRAVKPTAANTEWDTAIARAMPDLKAAEADIGRPVAGVTDALEATSAAKKKVWQEYQQKLDQARAVDAGPLQMRDPQTGRLQPVTHEPTINGNEIADAMEQSVTKRQAQLNPNLAERVKAAAATYRRPMTLDEAEDFLQDANNELHSYYAKNKVGRRAATADPEMASTVAEAEQLRDSLYGKLDELTGPGASDIKQRYGALSNVENELLRRKNVAARQQPESLAEQIGKAAGYGKIAAGVGATLAGSPGAGVTLAGEGVMQAGLSKWLKGRQTTDALITKAFADYGQPQSGLRTLISGTRGEAGAPGTVREEDQAAAVPPVESMRRTPEQTRADIQAAVTRDPAMAEVVQHEANMRQRAAEAQAQREALGPLIRPAEQPITVGPETKPNVPSPYERHGIAQTVETPNAPAFFSKAEKAAQSLPGSASGQQMLATLKNQGVKPGELEQLGIEGFLKGKAKVSRADVQDFVARNKLQVGEETLGKKGADTFTLRRNRQNDWDIVGPNGNRFGTLGGHMPEEEARQFARDQYQGTTEGKKTKYERYTLPGEKANYEEKLLTYDPKGGLEPTTDPYEQRRRRIEEGASQFQSSHWDEPNVLAHARWDDRTTADGKKALFLEEAQSDWHQKGKKEGYQNPKRLAELDAKLMREGKLPPDEAKEYDTLTDRQVLPRTKGGVPDAPFKADWHELVVKRALREAAERGADRLAWTTGEQQAERYDLSKQVGKLYYTPEHNNLIVYDPAGRNVVKNIDNVPPDKLPDYIGKDVAQKLLASKQDRFGAHQLAGDNLKIGGEWAKALYDRAIPNFLNKYAKKWGARVGESELGKESMQNRLVPEKTGGDYWILQNDKGTHFVNEKGEMKEFGDETESMEFKTRAAAQKWADQNSKKAQGIGVKVHSIDITPAMRKAILKEGQPIASARTFGEERPA